MTMDGSKRAEVSDVEVLEDTGLVLRCRVDGKVVGVPPRLILEGSEIKRPGDRGRLVLPLELAQNLGLIPPLRW